jgi:hypothetical protein
MLRREAHRVQQFRHPLALAAGVQPVQHQRLGQRLGDRHARVQRRIRVLKDDLQ